MPNGQKAQGFDVNGARQAGYSDDEIMAHLTQSRNFDVQSALKSGYSQGDIINYLATSPRPPSVPTEQQAAANPPNAVASFAQRTIQPVQDPVSQGFSNQKPIQMTGTPPAQEIYQDVRQGQYAKGIHKAATTAAGAYAPLAIPAAITSPLPFLTSLGGGAVGQYGLRRGAQALGLSPDQADVAGDVGALAGGTTGYGAGKIASNALPASSIPQFLANVLRHPETGAITATPSSILDRIIPQRSLPPLEYNTAPLPASGEFYENQGKALMTRERQQAMLDRQAARTAKANQSAPQTPQFGQGGTFTNSPNLPPAQTVPQLGSATNPDIKFVTKFEPQGKSVIQDPNSPPPNTRVTYQSVPQGDLLRMVNSGDRQAIAEWQRRGLGLPENVGFMVEPGAGTLPWRRYKR